jgi:hypothetical protein
MFLPATIHLSDTPREGWTSSFRLTFDGRQVQPVEVTVKSTGDQAVTGADLRAVAVNSIVSEALADATRTQFVDFDVDWWLPPDKWKELREEGPTDAALKYFAEFYAFGYALKIPATEFAIAHMQLSKPTAARWIRKAREKGLIPDGDD